MRNVFYIAFIFLYASFAEAQIHDSISAPTVIPDSLVQQTKKPKKERSIYDKVYPLPTDSSKIVNRKFRPDFKDDYDSSDFDYTYQKQKQRSMWDKFKEWLARMLNINVSPSNQMAHIFNFFFKLLGALAVIAAIGFIIKLIIDKKFENIFGKKSKKKDVEIYDIEKNIHEVDFDKLTQDTVSKGAYRLATRYYFLWLLKRLSQAEIIQWNPDKTNTEYLSEIQQPETKTQFQYLSYIYDNVWYGEFEIDQIDFENIKKSFESLLNQYQKYER